MDLIGRLRQAYESARLAYSFGPSSYTYDVLLTLGHAIAAVEQSPNWIDCWEEWNPFPEEIKCR
jgi:hypothetical protein